MREAAEQLVAAARLAPTEGARAAAAARALRDARRCRSAERWYAKAVQLKPEVRSHRHGLYILVPLKKNIPKNNARMYFIRNRLSIESFQIFQLYPNTVYYKLTPIKYESLKSK